MPKRAKKKNGNSCTNCHNYPCFLGQDNCVSDFGKEGCELWRKQ